MQVEAAQWWLTHGADKGRSGEYRLGGRCRLTGVPVAWTACPGLVPPP
jgi:hypothetical protein